MTRRPEGPTIWDVWIHKSATTHVLVMHSDPAEARRIALEQASDWQEPEPDCRAYTLEGKAKDRVWTEDGWIYPPTDLFEGEQ